MVTILMLILSGVLATSKNEVKQKRGILGDLSHGSHLGLGISELSLGGLGINDLYGTSSLLGASSADLLGSSLTSDLHLHHTPTTFDHQQETVPVAIPHPVPFIITKTQPIPVPKPIPVEIPKPIPVPIPHAVPVPISKPIPVPIDRPIPVHIPKVVPVSVKQPIPVPYPQPYPVTINKAIPVPVPVPHIIPDPKPILHSSANLGWSDAGAFNKWW